MTIKELKNKWQQNVEFYRQQEIGSGVHSFVKDVFISSALFDLEETPKKTNKFGTFTHDSEKKKEGRPDFVLYISKNVAIPVEVKCYGRIKEGVNQLLRYQLDYSKQLGIVTDGYEWRFYYYFGIFNPVEASLFEEKIDLNNPENRKVFFEDTTKLIENFRIKMQTLGIWGEAKSVEENKSVADFVSFHIYKPFKEEQESINNQIFTNFKSEYAIDLDIADFTPENILKNQDKLSLIDPSCDAGTFLYSAVDRIITSFFPTTYPKTDSEKKQLKQTAEYVKKYNKNSVSFSDYYTHTIAIKKFKSNFYFDGGYNIDERMILQEKSDYAYPKVNNKYFTIKEFYGYWQNIRTGNSAQKIALRQGNQKYNLLDSKYKILWTHANTKRCFFTDKPVIWAKNQFNAIGSNNKNEILFLFSLLNAPLSFSILKKNLKSENEKNLDLAIKSIKQYIRIPKITISNQHIKNKIIEQTAKMLALENVTLKDLVDFSGLTVQRLKNHIDNLIFALYFEVGITENQLDNFEFVQKECEKTEYYEYF